MQELKFYVHCPDECKFVPVRFCDEGCEHMEFIDEREVGCNHDNDCFSEGDEE